MERYTKKFQESVLGDTNLDNLALDKGKIISISYQDNAMAKLHYSHWKAIGSGNRMALIFSDGKNKVIINGEVIESIKGNLMDSRGAVVFNTHFKVKYVVS